jgi:glycosyltransferase involved in cell wall biosynthesis
MRILIVTEMWPPYSSAFVAEQVKSLAPHISITVAVLTPDPPALPRYRSMRSPLAQMSEGPHRLPELREQVLVYYLRYRTIPELGKYLNSLQAWRALARFLRLQHQNFDLIHAHFAYALGYAAARAGRRFNLPVVVTAHGSDINFYTRRTLRNWAAAGFTIWGVRHASAVTVVSADLKKKVLALNVPADRITIIPAGIRETIFFPRGEKKSLRQQLRLAEKDVLLLFVGNLLPVKGLEFLLTAFAHVGKQRSGVKLVVVGSGKLESSLKQLAQKLGLERNLTWAGKKSHEEIPLWMNAADFLVLPSLSEGYPMVVLEALACGTPVIASRVGGIPEILVSPDFGVMVPSRDSDALAHAILAAVEQKWDTGKLVAYAHANTWTERAQRFLKVYQNVLAPRAENRVCLTTDFGL